MKKIINILIISIFILAIFFTNYILGLSDIKDDSSVDLTLLKAENEVLKNELNQSLELNQLDKYIEYDYIKSLVLLRDIYEFSDTITIKYGKDQNIKKGMAVMSANGLIGIIDKVNQNTSIVKLITSKAINISVMIDENYGILNGIDSNNKYLEAAKFNNYEIIMKNDDVYTSGLGLIPSGLYIGKVINTKDINENIEQSVSIQSDVNFNKIKYIAIIRGIKEL